MESNKITFLDLFNERKANLFSTFESIYEGIISNLNIADAVSSDRINSLVESTTKKIAVSEREQFIFYLTTIITEMAKSVNEKSPDLIKQLKEDINEFNHKYDSNGEFAKIMNKYFSQNEIHFVNPQKFSSFFPNYLGFSFEASFMRSMLFELRSIISKSLKNFSEFTLESKMKCQQFINEINQSQFKKSNFMNSKSESNQTFVEESIVEILTLIDSELQDKEKLKKIKTASQKLLTQIQNKTSQFNGSQNSKDAIIYELQSQINDLKIEALRSSVSKSQLFNNEYSNHSMNDDSLSKSISNQTNNETTIQTNDFKNEILDLKSQLANSNQNFQILKEKNKEKNQIISNLKGKIEEDSIQLEVYAAKIKQLKQQIKSLENDSSQSLFSKSSSKDSILMQQIAEKMTVIANQEKTIQQLQKEVKTLRSQTDMMQEHSSISAKQVQMLKEDLQHVQNSSLNDINEMSIELKEKNELLRMQNEKIAQFTQIQNKSDKYYKLKYEYKNILVKYANHKEKSRLIQMKSQNLLEQAAQKIKQINDELQNMKFKYEKKKKVNEYLVKQNQYLNNQLELLTKSKNQATQITPSDQLQISEDTDIDALIKMMSDT